MAVEERRSVQEGFLPNPGPFLAKIVSHLDSKYMGSLEVELLSKAGSDSKSSGQVFQVRYLNPFYGVTSAEFLGNENTYNDSQKSYGMWFVPPDVGGIVMVIFVEGDTTKGYWMGCVQDEFMNFMVPGIAATEANDEPGRAPTAEFNRQANDIAISDPEQIYKPVHPLKTVLTNQGLIEDDIRGITTSSARREWPSAVFGISTPGPVDKQENAKQGNIGKAESEVTGAFVSRLGGTTFVMDDGDDKFIRMTPASDGPPEYESLEVLGEGETPAGRKTIPHNELVRIRTRTGHQILMHNSEDLIYIGNARGTSWIELSSDGKIDIFAEDSISVHTKQDFNFYANRDFNIEVGRNFNLKVAGRYQQEVGENFNLIVKGDRTIAVAGNQNIEVTGNQLITTKGDLDISTSGTTKLYSDGSFNLKSSGNNNFTTDGNTNINSGGNHIEEASMIHMNGPSAESAAKASAAAPPEALSTFVNPIDTENGITSIMLRVPNHEPWPHHENLDPVNFKPEKTDREAGSNIEIPTAWKEYSTKTDTFAKIKGT
jgi:hypothetical protein